MHCPRYVAVTQHAGDRLLLCHDDAARLTEELRELSVSELPHSVEAIIDLENETRHAADTRAVISFTPPLPGGGTERVIVMRHAHPGALKHAADVLEEYADGHPELTDAIGQFEDLLARWRAAAPATARTTPASQLRPRGPSATRSRVVPLRPRRHARRAHPYPYKGEVMNTSATIVTTAAPVSLAPVPGCVVTLCTTITQDQGGRDVEILDEARSVKLADSPRGLGAVLPGDLEPAERRTVAEELAAFVTREPRGAFVLERLLLNGDGRAIHVEARVLPVDEREQRDLAELLDEKCDPDGGRDLAALYAADVEAAWVQRADGTPLPVRFLEEFNRCSTANHDIAAPLQHAA